jgi:hypothetical protein
MQQINAIMEMSTAAKSAAIFAPNDGPFSD